MDYHFRIMVLVLLLDYHPLPSFTDASLDYKNVQYLHTNELDRETGNDI